MPKGYMIAVIERPTYAQIGVHVSTPLIASARSPYVRTTSRHEEAKIFSSRVHAEKYVEKQEARWSKYGMPLDMKYKFKIMKISDARQMNIAERVVAEICGT